MYNFTRFQYLSKLFKTSDLPIGENSYLIGKRLGLNENEVNEIILYYKEGGTIEFPILGPFVKLVRDWYKTLNEEDRYRLEENFLIELKKLDRGNNRQDEFPIDFVFESMGLKAYSEQLAPITAYSLKEKNLISINNDFVKITEKGWNEATRIEKERFETWKKTMSRLNMSTKSNTL